MSTARRLDRTDVPRRPTPLGGDLIDRQPPFDLQAEIGVLGSIVLLPDMLDEVALLLRPDDFYDDSNRRLFTHMCALHEGNKKIDITLLVDRLKAGELRFAAEDPDAPENFPRVCTLWRANLLGSSSKGHEYFLRHILGVEDAAVRNVIAAGKTLTGDLGGIANTAEFTEALIAAINS